MNKYVTIAAGALVLFGAGCTSMKGDSTPVNTPVMNEDTSGAVQKTSVYKNTKMGYEFEYPEGWKVFPYAPTANNQKLKSVLDWQMVEIESREPFSKVNVVWFSKKDAVYAEEAARPAAITGEKNGKFYVINYYGSLKNPQAVGGAKVTPFEMVVETFQTK